MICLFLLLLACDVEEPTLNPSSSPEAVTPAIKTTVKVGEYVVIAADTKLRNQPTNNSPTFTLQYYTNEKVLFEYMGEENGYGKVKIVNQESLINGNTYFSGNDFFASIALFFYVKPEAFLPVTSKIHWHVDTAGLRSLLMPGVPIKLQSDKYVVADERGEYLGAIPPENIALSYQPTDIHKVYKSKVKEICDKPKYTPQQWKKQSEHQMKISTSTMCDRTIPVYSFRKDEKREIALLPNVGTWLYSEIELQQNTYFVDDYFSGAFAMGVAKGSLVSYWPKCSEQRFLQLPREIELFWQDGTPIGVSESHLLVPFDFVQQHQDKHCFHFGQQGDASHKPIWICAELHDLVLIQGLQKVFPIIDIALVDRVLSVSEEKILQSAFERHEIESSVQEAFARIQHRPEYFMTENWLSWICSNLVQLPESTLSKMLLDAEIMAKDGGISQSEKELLKRYDDNISGFVAQKKLQNGLQ